MSLAQIFQNTLAPVARRLGLEIIPERGAQRDLSLEGALNRVRTHNLRVGGVIDVGASNGRWSRTALNHFPDAKFLLVDPLEERRAALERLRQECSRVQFELAAAGDREGDVTFHVSDDLDGSGVAENAGSARQVPLVTLDALVARHRLPGPYFLKLDTHGFEIPIFEGARTTLGQTSVIMVEVYNFQLTPTSLRFHEMCAWLEKAGFRCFDMVDPYLRPLDGAFWQMDLLFAPATSPMFQRATYR